jgi:hypothetical protein
VLYPKSSPARGLRTLFRCLDNETISSKNSSIKLTACVFIPCERVLSLLLLEEVSDVKSTHDQRMPIIPPTHLILIAQHVYKPCNLELQMAIKSS